MKLSSHDLIHHLTTSGHILPAKVIEGSGKARGDCNEQACKGDMWRLIVAYPPPPLPLHMS